MGIGAKFRNFGVGLGAGISRWGHSSGAHTKSQDVAAQKPSAARDTDKPVKLLPESKFQELDTTSQGSKSKESQLRARHAEVFKELGNPETFGRLIDERFKSLPGDPNSLRMLQGVVQAIRDTCPQSADPDSKEELNHLKGDEMRLLVSVAARVCRQNKKDGANPEKAARALQCLRNIDLLRNIRNPKMATAEDARVNPHQGVCRTINGKTFVMETLLPPKAPNDPRDPQPFNDEDVANAWRIAIALTEGDGEHLVNPVGFDLLKRMTSCPTRSGVHDSVARKNDEVMLAYLAAAREYVKVGPTQSPDPLSLHHALEELVANASFAKKQADALAKRIEDYSSNHTTIITDEQIEDYATAVMLPMNEENGDAITLAKDAVNRVKEVTLAACKLAQDDGAIEQGKKAADSAKETALKALAQAATAALSFLPSNATAEQVQAARNLLNPDLQKKIEDAVVKLGENREPRFPIPKEIATAIVNECLEQKHDDDTSQSISLEGLIRLSPTLEHNVNLAPLFTENTSPATPPKEDTRSVIRTAIIKSLNSPQHVRQIKQAVAEAACISLDASSTTNQEAAVAGVARAAALQKLDPAATVEDVVKAAQEAVPGPSAIALAARSAVPKEGVLRDPEKPKCQKMFLGNALLALQDHAQKLEKHAASPDAKKPFYFHMANQHANAAAARAVANGMYRIDQPDKEKRNLFTYVNGRCKKYDIWYKRAAKTEANPSGNEERNGWQKAKNRITEFFTPNVGKSPLRAYDQIIAGKDGVGLSDMTENGIRLGREMKQVVIQEWAKAAKLFGAKDGTPLPQQVEVRWDPAAGGLQVTDDTALTTMMRLAIMEQQQAKSLFMPAYKELKQFSTEEDDYLNVDCEYITAAKQKVLAQMGLEKLLNELPDEDKAQAQAQAQALVRDLFKRENARNPNVDCLVAWVKELPGAPTADKAVQLLQTAQTALPTPKALPNWREYGQALDILLNKNFPALQGANEDGSLPKVADKETDRARFAQVWADGTRNQELGSSVTIASGRTSGLRTGKITQTFTGKVSAGLARVGVNVGGTRETKAMMSASVGTAGAKTGFGTVTTSKGIVGGSFGQALGLEMMGIKKVFGAGYNVASDLFGTKEERKIAFLRFSRMHSYGVNGDGWDIENNERGGHAYKNAMLQLKLMNSEKPPIGHAWVDPGNPDYAEEPVLRALQEWEDLSVYRHDYRKYSVGVNVSASGNASASFKELGEGLKDMTTDGYHDMSEGVEKTLGAAAEVLQRLGASASLGVTANLTYSQASAKETGGRVAEEIKETAIKYDVKASFLVNTLATLFPDFTVGQIAGVLGVNVADLGKLEAVLIRGGHTERTTIIKEQGKAHGSTFHTLTCENAASYLAVAAPMLNEMTADMVRRWQSGKWNGGPGVGDPPVDISSDEASLKSAYKEAAMKRKYDELREFLTKAVQGQDLSEHFQLYMEVKKGSLETYDHATANIIDARKEGDEARAKQFEKLAEDIKQRKDVRYHAFVIGNSTRNITSARGINEVGGATAMSSHSVDISRIQTFVG